MNFYSILINSIKKLPVLIASIVVCELVGILATPFTIAAIPTWYAHLIKPPFSPPNWIFGPVWTLLYFLMGISFYQIWQIGWKKKKVKLHGLMPMASLDASRYAGRAEPFRSMPHFAKAMLGALLRIYPRANAHGILRMRVKTAGYFFGAQLALNFLWSISFFGLRSPLLGMVNIVALWVLIVLTMKKFYPLSQVAFYLLVPYILWVSFAMLLNGAIVFLN